MSAQTSLEIKNGSIHYAKLEASQRLQNVLRFMSDGKPHTSMEIIVGGNVTNAPTAICELRENGYAFDQWADYPNGKMVQSYMLISLDKALEFFKKQEGK